MTSDRMWCAACNAAVGVGVRQGVMTFAAPPLGALVGAMLGGRNRGAGAVGGALVGFALTVLINALTPKAQELICGRCGRAVA